MLIFKTLLTWVIHGESGRDVATDIFGVYAEAYTFPTLGEAQRR